MRKSSIFIFSFLLLILGCSSKPQPVKLIESNFSGPDVTPSPACLAVSEDGAVFVGIDMAGSLGKKPGKGTIVRLVDADQDGVMDKHTVFAVVDNPRGMVSVGDKLWVLHTAFGKDEKATGMDLVVFEDKDRDGVADGPSKILIKGICSPESLRARGTDHSTNGIQIGIDGWIYIAVGDFGFHNAKGIDGRTLTLLGGGIVRVRPDGTEMELFTTGMRNIYDIAIDPFMNIFTRGNTNDGGGWNVRFTHHIQSGEYGYPRLFISFPDEVIPALEDVGGGSGVGAFFLAESSWPEYYRNQPFMADWGRNIVFLHRLTKDGASFQQKPEIFLDVPQVTDLDVTPTGVMYVSAWDGAGFKGSDDKGHVIRVVPEGWQRSEYVPVRDRKKEGVYDALKSGSAVSRLHAQQELIKRAEDDTSIKGEMAQIARDTSLSLEARVAAFYGYSQIEQDKSKVLQFADVKGIKEFALNAAADRLTALEDSDLDLDVYKEAIENGTPREKAKAAIALGRIGKEEGASALLNVSYKKKSLTSEKTHTGLLTLKGNHRTAATRTLKVKGKKKVFLYLLEQDMSQDPRQFYYVNPHFLMEDGTKKSILGMKAIKGKYIANVELDESQKKAIEKAQEKNDDQDGFLGAIEASAGEEPLAFKVPKGAVEFSTYVMNKSPMKTKDPKKVMRRRSAYTFVSTEYIEEGKKPSEPHATPNAEIILPHLAMQSLVKIKAVKSGFKALDEGKDDLSLWALSHLHTKEVVDGLLDRLNTAQDSLRRKKILSALSRLYQKESPYDGSWWWTTRPDTRGPYYKPMKWEESEKIQSTLLAEWDQADENIKYHLTDLNDRERLKIASFGTHIKEEDLQDGPTVDLAKIASQKGAVGKTPIEDVILSLDKYKGDYARGEELFTLQGCVACHALDSGAQVNLGPYMGQIGSIMNKEKIATAILRPNDTISQGFQTSQITMKDGTVHIGFVTENNVDKVVLRDMAGQAKTLVADDIKSDDHLNYSMMPEGLANSLTLQDFASLVHFLSEQK